MKHELITQTTWLAPLDSYLAYLISSGTAESTIKLYGNHLRRFAMTTKLNPFEPDTAALVDYLGSRQHWAPNTRKSHRSALRSFYSWARYAGHVATDPAERLPVVRTQQGVPRPAPETAVRHGLALLDKRLRTMVRLAAQLGLRCCEICQVSTDDVFEDLAGYSLLVHGKGNKKRLVKLTDDLARAIRQHDGYLFPGRIDGHLSASYTSKIMSSALPGSVTAHQMRHRFASVAYDRGGKDIRAVQKLLGHASVATTQIYVEVPDDALRRAVEAAA